LLDNIHIIFFPSKRYYTNTYPLSKINPFRTSRLHYKVHSKSNLIIKNINNYCVIAGLFNGVELFFKTTIESHLTFEIWIEFSNLKIGQHTHTHTHNIYIYFTIQHNWNPIKYQKYKNENW